jgi:hypothetical protein
MRVAKITVFVAAVFVLSPLSAFAQSAIPDGPPPALGPPALDGAAPLNGAAPFNGVAPPPATGLLPSTTPGSAKVGDDGTPTRTVKAVPCGIVARETDGFTTCIGIPDSRDKSSKTR